MYGDLEIMQYTGLKDKNGKEIYEGDILFFDENMPVEMYNGAYICKRKKKHDMLLLSISYQSKIIGNIYENKNLLK